MPSYRYAAKERTGRSLAGMLEAADEKVAANLLRKQDLIIISIKEEKKKEKSSGKTGSSHKVRLSELVLFSRQLATMIDSGIPLVQSLEMIGDQLKQSYFKEVLFEVKKDVSTGSSFYEALGKHPQVFSSLFVNMAKAGESSGALDDIMDRLASYLEKTDQLTRKVKAAMIYPMIVSSMACLITLVMMLKVVPVFKSMYADLGGQLPVPTRMLIFVSDLLIRGFFLWAGLLTGGFFLLKRYLRTEKGQFRFDDLKLSVPIFGPILKKVAISKFSRTLATLVKSGVPILTALEIVGKTAGNRLVEAAVEKVRKSVREGTSIAEPLLKSRVFPPMVPRMIAVGEQTGQLEKMLTKIADFYDDQVNASVSGLTSLIEPLVIAFLGVVIGGIVICMFLPIFKLSALVQA